MRWLLSEFEQARAALSSAHTDHLAGLGVEPWVCSTTVGIGKVERFGGYYQPFDEGLASYILPIGRRVLYPPEKLRSEEDVPPWDYVEDLVAVFPGTPDIWALRRGDGIALGFSHIEDAIIDRAPVELYETPLDWLKAGASGACIVNWPAFNPFVLFAQVREVYCQTPALERRLQIHIDELSAPAFRIGSLAAAE